MALEEIEQSKRQMWRENASDRFESLSDHPATRHRLMYAENQFNRNHFVHSFEIIDPDSPFRMTFTPLLN